METNITAASAALYGEEKYKDVMPLETRKILPDYITNGGSCLPNETQRRSIAGKLIVENTQIWTEVYKNPQNKDDTGKNDDKEFIEKLSTMCE